MTKKHYIIDKGFRSVHQGDAKIKGPISVKEDNLLLANSLNIGYYLITPLLIGVFFGVVVDRFFDTKPLFTVSLIVCGVIGTFYNLAKLTKRTDASH